MAELFRDTSCFKADSDTKSVYSKVNLGNQSIPFVAYITPLPFYNISLLFAGIGISYSFRLFTVLLLAFRFPCWTIFRLEWLLDPPRVRRSNRRLS
jgi:hypothetical protein